MADRHKNARFRRVAILALLLILLATALGTEFFPNKGHSPSKDGTAASGGGAMVDGAALALLPLDHGVLHPGARRKTARLYATDSDEDFDGGFEGGEGLQNLVYQLPGGGGDKPQSDGDGDGDHGWSLGGGVGGGAPGFGGGGGGPGGGSPFDAGGPDSFGGPGSKGDDPGHGPIGRDPLIAPPSLPLILSPVPEPATWTMLILGFGAVGAALRRARRTAQGSTVPA